MNAIWKRLTALTLAGAMCFGMAGCGNKTEKTTQTKTLAQELGYGYLSKYDTLDVGLDYVSSVSAAQGKLYVSGDSYDQTTEGNTTKLYSIDLASGQTTEVPMPALTQTETSSESVQKLIVSADGSGYWMVTSTYTYTGDVTDGGTAVPASGDTAATEGDAAAETPAETTENTDTQDTGAVAENADGMAVQPRLSLLTDETTAAADGTADAAETPAEATDTATDTAEAATDSTAEATTDTATEAAVDDGQTYAAKKCDMNGNVVTQIDLTAATKDLEYFSCTGLAESTDGDLLIGTDSAILCFGSDGTQKTSIPFSDGYIQSMVVSGDGTIAINYYSQTDGKMEISRIENGAVSAPVELTGFNENGNMTLFPGDGKNLLLSDGTLLYSLDVSTGAATKLLSWLDSDISGNNVNGIAASGSDTLLVLMAQWNNTGNPTYELGTLTKTDADKIPKRTILTMGALYLDDTLQNAIINFNRKSDTYRITLKDYSTYNTTDDYTLGTKQLDKDVISGDCPDILSLSSGGNVEKYISKGALADLTELMDKDSEVNTGTLLAGPLKAYSSGGKVYGMPYNFNYQTLLASAKLVGDKTSWTMADMNSVIGSLDENTKVMGYFTQSDFLTIMTYQNLGQFVDYSKSTCSFDSDAFKSLMQAAAKLPAQNDTSDDGTIVASNMGGDEFSSVQSGDVLMAIDSVYDASSAKSLYNLYTKENGFVRIGYPTDGESGSLISIGGGLAISEKCQSKDGAWAFIKTMLTDDVQENQWSLPVTVTAFDALMSKAMQPDTYTDENGNQVETNSTGYIGSTEYPMANLTQDQVDDFKNAVNNATVSGNYDTDLLQIITDESAAFFSGDKTADEVAKLIQNRVSIYLGETG